VCGVRCGVWCVVCAAQRDGERDGERKRGEKPGRGSRGAVLTEDLRDLNRPGPAREIFDGAESRLDTRGGLREQDDTRGGHVGLVWAMARV